MKMKRYGWYNLHAVTQNFYTLFGKVVCRWNWPTHCSYGNHLVVKMTIIYSLSLVLRVRIFLQYSQTHSHWVLDSLSQIVPYIVPYIVVPGEFGKRGSPSKGTGGRGITADSQRELDNRHHVTMIMYTEVVDDESDDSHVIEWSEEGGRWSPWAWGWETRTV